MIKLIMYPHNILISKINLTFQGKKKCKQVIDLSMKSLLPFLFKGFLLLAEMGLTELDIDR